MQENKIVKACNFYVSEWHLFAALLPYLKDELKKNNVIFFISQDDLKSKLKELVERINFQFENKNGIEEIKWLREEYFTNIKNEYMPMTIIIQGNYKFVEGINECIDYEKLNLYGECKIINCYEIFDSNEMLHNILEKHELVFNTGGFHEKREIFPDYSNEKISSKSS